MRLSVLRASAEQRRAFLRRLFDVFGSIDHRTAVAEVRSTDRPLLERAREVVCSLGFKPRSIEAHGTGWRLRWSLFECGPNGRRVITAIRPVGSVPVRCIAVDSQSHLYLAGHSMIPTHNTSFALGIAAHAALDARAPVLIFSLEMSHLELTQRLLCSEARVDATRMRNGRLLDTDWPKISHAVGRLAEAPINIDDNPHLTVMEIRAKARRLKSRQGLGLIVIDYLQLMTGRQSAENRQVEVSEISRGLKILARELEVPVVALSQLSRNLETRADKRPVLADLRESGCLTADTRVLRADTGAEVTMGELFLRAEQDILVWSLDESLAMVPATMRRVFSTGIKPVFELEMASGRSVRATANHPFLTCYGWKRVDELRVGNRIAAPCRIHALAGVGGFDAEDSGLTPPEEVAWDDVVAVRALGQEMVFDAQVDPTHNFVANGLVSSNSLEQDADVVVFLYRDELYNRDSPDRGTAEVIVAKHRNGPTGVTQLAFLENYTRFANMARGV